MYVTSVYACSYIVSHPYICIIISFVYVFWNDVFQDLNSRLRCVHLLRVPPQNPSIFHFPHDLRRDHLTESPDLSLM